MAIIGIISDSIKKPLENFGIHEILRQMTKDLSETTENPQCLEINEIESLLFCHVGRSSCLVMNCLAGVA